MMVTANACWHLPFILRLFTVPVSIVCIIAFSHVIAWNPWDIPSGFADNWEWGIMYLEESAFLPVSLILSSYLSKHHRHDSQPTVATRNLRAD